MKRFKSDEYRDEAIEFHKMPKFKPPRRDLRKLYIDIEDEDFDDIDDDIDLKIAKIKIK